MFFGPWYCPQKHGWGHFLPQRQTIMTKRFNEPNYSAYVMGYRPGSGFCEVDFRVEQVCRKGKASVEAVNNRVIEDIEGLAALTGLEYRVCVPENYSDPKWYNDTRRVDVVV